MKTKNGADLMLVRILALFAEFERDQRSKAMKAAMQRKKARGEYTGGGCPTAGAAQRTV